MVIKELYDNFESNRNGIKVFERVGFKKVDKYNWEKFDKDIEIIVVKKNYR